MGSRLEKNSEAVRKRIESHTFDSETGEEYEGSKFGGFSDYFRRKKIKLQNLDAEIRSSSPATPQIFKGIVAHVNGYTQPSLNYLHRMVVTHGGGFMQYLDGKTTVTHIIAANMTLKKAIEFKRYRIVKPAWIVDSVNAGKIQPWENYKVIDEGPAQRVLGFNDGKIVSQAVTQSRGYQDQTKDSWYTSQFKSIAEGIDAGDGVLDQAVSQPVASNIMPARLLPPASNYHETIRPDIVDDNLQDSEPDASYPGSFGVSSSLEELLKTVDSTSLQQYNNEAKAELQVATKEVNAAKEKLDLIMEDTLDSASPVDRKSTRPVDPSSPSRRIPIMTAEEHNAILLSDPHIRKSSTANPDFLKQYYSESRLHHLSTWKADLKARLQQMAAERSPSQKHIHRRKAGSRRYIMHVDFDSFFCAVSLRSAPEYVDKPAVVAHGTGLGSEIASCNYPARAFGVKNGMWMKNALKLCPDIKVLPYNFSAYEEASRNFYTAILDVGGMVQSVSVDEALVDISTLCIPAGSSDEHGISEESIWLEQEKANKIAQNLRHHIKELTGCAVSIGIGGNILLAKVALRKAKPAGQHLIRPEEILDFIGELLVQDLPGVAYSIGGKLEEIGVKYVRDVRMLSKDRLMTVLGPKTGEKIWDYSRGIDKTEIGEQVARKSVSAEINWGIRFINQLEAEEFMQTLCGELHRRLLDQGVKGIQLTVKIMRRAADAPLDPPKHLGHGKCDTFNKSVPLGVATNSAEVIGREAVSVLRSYGFSPGELRGLGVQMTKLEPLKASIDGWLDGSQKKISFNSANAPKLMQKEAEDIDDPDSPRKPKTPLVHPAALISKTNAADKSAKKPLNLTGTQFILPTQFDSAVLAELPYDIRSKLLAQTRSGPASRAQSPIIKSRSQSPVRQLGDTLIPSQLDPEVFEFLPEDVKAEYMAFYESKSTAPRAYSKVPQPPHKARALPPSKKITTPTKKRTGILFRSRGNNQDLKSTLTQSNFVTGVISKGARNSKNPTDSEDHQSDTLDPDFLIALPEDVRAEVIAEHRRSRLARHSGLELVTAKKTRPVSNLPPGQSKIRLPPAPKKPTFTTQELSKLPELRHTIRAWHEEFLCEGPHVDDVSAMERYLRRVVLEEKDMPKAVSIVKWLAWLVDDAHGRSGAERGIKSWKQALEGIKEKVRNAVKDRGLGPPGFE